MVQQSMYNRELLKTFYVDLIDIIVSLWLLESFSVTYFLRMKTTAKVP